MKMEFLMYELKADAYSEPIDISGYIKDLYLFGFLTEGEAVLEIDGTNLLLRPGQLILVPISGKIIIKHYDKSKGHYGAFSLDFLKDASYPVLQNGRTHLQTFWFEDAVFMGNLMRRMLTAHQDKDTPFLRSALDLILSQVHSDGKVAVIPEKFLQMVFDSNEAPMSVSEYASILNVSPNYLNKTVKQHTHRTAIDWIEIARLNLAQMLLKDHNVPIGEIAGRVGVPDQSYFSRFFKKKTGLTPSEYRNNNF